MGSGTKARVKGKAEVNRAKGLRRIRLIFCFPASKSKGRLHGLGLSHSQRERIVMGHGDVFVAERKHAPPNFSEKDVDIVALRGNCSAIGEYFCGLCCWPEQEHPLCAASGDQIGGLG